MDLGKKVRKENVTLRVTKDFINEMDAIANDLKMSRSSVMVKGLEYFIANQEKIVEELFKEDIETVKNLFHTHDKVKVGYYTLFYTKAELVAKRNIITVKLYNNGVLIFDNEVQLKDIYDNFTFI